MLEDHLFCFHPLVPIYILLTSFYNQLGSELEEDPFLASYISYFNVLEKMTHSLIENYLKSEDVSKIMEAFIIGSSLQTTFFTSNKSLTLFEDLGSVSELDPTDLRMFTLKNSVFSGPVIGDILVDPDSIDEKMASILLHLPIFSSFMKGDSVQFKETLLDESNSDYESLKTRMDVLLNLIVDRVVKDRKPVIGQTEGTEGSDVQAEARGVDIYGLPKGIRATAAEKASKKASEGASESERLLKPFDPTRIRTGDSIGFRHSESESPKSNVVGVTSSTGSSTGRGGNNTKKHKRKHHKHVTRRTNSNKNNKKTINKTKKRVNRKERKNKKSRRM